MDGGAEQGFVGIDVPHTDHGLAVHNQLFDRDAPARTPGVEISAVEPVSKGFRAEIDELVAEYRGLFGRTMPTASLDFEIRIRFQETRELFSR